MATPAFTDEQLRELSLLSFDFLCQRRLTEFVDVAQIMAAVEAAATPERVGHAQGRWVGPQRARLIERAKKSGVKLGAWLPAAARDELAAALGEPAPLPRSWVEEAIGSERVRDEVKTLLHDTLTGFVSKATSGLGEAAPPVVGGALGALRKNLAAASKGVLGGLGESVQRQLQERVEHFVDGSVAAVQRKITERLLSDDTAAQMGKRRRAAFLKALEWDEGKVARWVEKQTNPKLEGLAPAIIQHNLARAELREAIEGEVRAQLEELGKQTIGELLDEAGLREWARQGSERAGVPLLRDFTASEGFAGWWSRAVG